MPAALHLAGSDRDGAAERRERDAGTDPIHWLATASRDERGDNLSMVRALCIANMLPRLVPRWRTL